MLSRLIRIPKKKLRRVFRIINRPIMKAEIKEKGKVAEATFHYGFRRFFIKKRRKEREILAPHPEVQEVLKKIKSWLEKTSLPHENAFGFVKGRNHKKAVEALLGNKHFFSFDIADAFPSIKIEMVENVLKELEGNEAIGKVLAWLVTYYYQYQRRLPQGASSSPCFLNLVYKPMCKEIEKVCREHKIKWSVYADDFNFAGESIPSELKKELMAIPLEYGFAAKKIKDNLAKTIPHLLGLTIVNGKIHIRRKRKKEFRRIIHLALKYDAYSPAKVRGIGEAIRCVYGEEENWPGWLLKPWKDYQTKIARDNS